MSDCFQLQQFSVIQKKSGMKICTDSLIFGSMAPVSKGDHVLDIGTGTGLLALMAAQLGAAKVQGVDIMRESFEEAQVNFEKSPWRDRMKAYHMDIRTFSETYSQKFDLIICNPPFFKDFNQIDDPLRRTARCNTHLTFLDILQMAKNHLTLSGKLYVLFPFDIISACISQAESHGFHATEKVGICSYAYKTPHVAALTFQFTETATNEKLLTIYHSHNIYTSESEKLLRSFLLRFA